MPDHAEDTQDCPNAAHNDPLCTPECIALRETTLTPGEDMRDCGPRATKATFDAKRIANIREIIANGKGGGNVILVSELCNEIERLWTDYELLSDDYRAIKDSNERLREIKHRIEALAAKWDRDPALTNGGRTLAFCASEIREALRS